jgi:MFS family permease
MMIAVASTMIGPAFPFISKEFALPLAMLGFLASAWNVGYLLTPVGGIISDRYGEPIVLPISFLIIGVAVGLAWTATDYLTLLALFLVAGVASAFGEVSANSLVSKLYPKRSAFALNVLHFSFSMGAFVGPALAGVLIVIYGSWRLPYLFACIGFAPLGVVALLSIPGARANRRVDRLGCDVSEGSSENIVRTIIRARVLLLASFFYGSAEMGANAWLPSFLVIERGFSVETASLSIGLFWASMAAGRLVLGNFADKVGYRRMIVTCALPGAASILAALLIEEMQAIVPLWCFSGFIFGPIVPTIVAWTATAFPSRRGLATGTIYSMGSLGAVLSPWLIGALADLYSLRISILYLAFSSMAAGLTALIGSEMPFAYVTDLDKAKRLHQ